jgi:hypothetical protein
MRRCSYFFFCVLLLVLLLPASASAGTLEGPRTIPEGLLTRVWNALVQPLTALWGESRGTMDPDGGNAAADDGSTTDGGGTMDPNGGGS